MQEMGKKWQNPKIGLHEGSDILVYVKGLSNLLKTPAKQGAALETLS